MGREQAQVERSPLPLLAAVALVTAGLFGLGVYLGDRHSGAVIAFERDYLGLDAAALVPASEAPASLPPKARQAGDPGVAAGATTAPAPGPQALPQPPAPSGQLDVTSQGLASGALAAVPGAALTQGPGSLQPAPTLPDLLAPPGGNLNVAIAPMPGPAPIAAHGPSSLPQPAPATLAASSAALAVPITLRVKVLVDDRLVDANDSWVLMALRTVSAASQVYRDLFGIELSLAGTVRWSGARTGVGGHALHQELRSHAREGADVVLGFVHTPLQGADYELGAPDDASGLNGVYGLVGPTPGAELSHLGGTLRALGHLLGGKSVREGSEDYRLGSFMSDAPPPAGRPPWIDLGNRERILARKGRPFQSELAP